MKRLRRLDPPALTDTYEKAQHGVVRHVALSEDGFRAIERDKPNHIVVDDAAVLFAQPRRQRIDLHYAFPDRDAFGRQFPAMLQQLVAAVSPDDGPLGFWFRLTERTSRPYLEPVLFAHAFELRREWMEMSLSELPETGPPADGIAQGFLLREPRRDDVEQIVLLEELAFPNPMLTVDAVEEALNSPSVYRVLEETRSGALVGSLVAERRPVATGRVTNIVVHPDFQRRGLGEAMLRWSLAWFRQEGLHRATLNVAADNAPAIALYRKLGFTPQEFGIDYRRPIDEDEVRQVLEKNRTEHIGFGKRR